MLMLIFCRRKYITLKNKVMKWILYQVSFISHEHQDKCKSPQSWKPVRFLVSCALRYTQRKQMGHTAETPELVPKNLGPDLIWWVCASFWCCTWATFLFCKAVVLEKDGCNTYGFYFSPVPHGASQIYCLETAAGVGIPSLVSLDTP